MDAFRFIVFIILCQAPAVLARITHFLPGNDQPDYAYETKYFTTLIDHFSFTNDDSFKLRYLISTENHVKGGPIFFYAGNEGSIETFAKNTGFMWDIAPEFHAALVFAEHRYYGLSLPFGNDSFKDAKHFGYLTAEQALADYSLLIEDLKKSDEKFTTSPVIVFGGSYGGMLAAWFRQKYPNIVAGSIASSAPIWLFPNMSTCDAFNRVVTYSFEKLGGATCRNAVRNIWSAIDQVAKGPDGLKFLTATFKLCSPLVSAGELTDYVIDFLGTVAMVNYPYEADFLGQLPAWPVKVFCKPFAQGALQDGPVEISRFAYALHSLTNYTGKQVCLDIKAGDPGLDVNGWELQTCMETTTPFCSNGKTDMFPPMQWDAAAFAASCKRQFGVVPRMGWSNVQFWGRNIKSSTNIVFSNGLLDPWSPLGVLTEQDAPRCTVITIPNGAHHLDLRAANRDDPDDVIKARDIEKKYIGIWIREWNKQ